MIQSGDGNVLTAQLLAADGAADHEFIGTLSGAGGQNIVLLHDLTGSVTQSRSLVGNVGIAADRAGVGGVAAADAVGIGDNSLVIVTQSIDRNGLAAQLCAADGAVDHGVVGTGLGAGGSLLVLPHGLRSGSMFRADELEDLKLRSGHDLVSLGFLPVVGAGCSQSDMGSLDCIKGDDGGAALSLAVSNLIPGLAVGADLDDVVQQVAGAVIAAVINTLGIGNLVDQVLAAQISDQVSLGQATVGIGCPEGVVVTVEGVAHGLVVSGLGDIHGAALAEDALAGDLLGRELDLTICATDIAVGVVCIVIDVLTGSGDHLGVAVAAGRADVGDAAIHSAGGSGDQGLIGVTQSINDLLGNQSLAAAGALLALGQTGGGAGGSHGGEDLLDVTQGGDGDGLAAQLYEADGAADHEFIGTLGGAGGMDLVILHDLAGSVIQSGNDLLGNQDLAADGTHLALGQTGGGAGGRHGRDDLLGVAQRCDHIVNVDVAAELAGVGGAAAGDTVGSGDNTLILVTQSLDDFLSSQDLAADGALLAVGHAGLGAGGGVALDDFFDVLGAQVLAADVTLEVLILVLVTQSGNGDGLTADLGLTDGAVDHGVIRTSLGAVGSILVLGHGLGGSVTQSIDLIGNIGVAAGGAGIGGVAAGGAGGIGDHGNIAVIQSLALGCAAGRAGLGSGAGCIDPLVLAGGGNDLGVDMAALAGIGLQTVGSTGCSLGGGGVFVGMGDCVIHNLRNADGFGAGIHDEPLAPGICKGNQIALAGLHGGDLLIAGDIGVGAVCILLQQVQLVGTIAGIAVGVAALIPVGVALTGIGSTGTMHMDVAIAADSHLAIVLESQNHAGKGLILLGDSVAVGRRLHVVMAAVAQAVAALGAGQGVLAVAQGNDTAVPVIHQGLCVLNGQLSNFLAGRDDLLAVVAVDLLGLAGRIQRGQDSGGDDGVPVTGGGDHIGVAVAALTGVGHLAGLGTGCGSGDFAGVAVGMLVDADAGDLELRNRDPAVIGLLRNELHIANSLIVEVDVLLAGVGVEGRMLCNCPPLGRLRLPDIQAGLGDQTAVVAVLTGDEGELIDDIGLTEVNDAGEGVGAVQLIGSTLPIGVPVGTGIVVPGVLELAFLRIVNGLGVHGNLLPESAELAEGVSLLGGDLHQLVQVKLGVVVFPAADAAAATQVVAVLAAGQALDGPAIVAVIGQLHVVAAFGHIGRIAADLQVAVDVLQLIAALGSLQRPDSILRCILAAGCGGQGMGTPVLFTLLIRQALHGAMQADHIGCIFFHLSDLLGDSQEGLFLCMGVTHGHQADDHDQRQQKAEKTIKFVSHFSHSSFRFLFFGNVSPRPHPFSPTDTGGAAGDRPDRRQKAAA